MAPASRVADVGGPAGAPGWSRVVEGAFDSPWTGERIAIERARLLRRMGRFDEAVAAWHDLTGRGGAVAIQAWIEVAKLREHRLGDPAGAAEAARRAAALAERRRRLGMGDPAVERSLARPDRAPAPGGFRPPDGLRGGRHERDPRVGRHRWPSVSRTQSRSGSNEQAIVRRSPASALR